MITPARATRSFPRRDGKAAESEIERRRNNRNYMRRWRADPRHRARERIRSSRLRVTHKCGEAVVRGKPVCGFCHLREPVRQVRRLKPSRIGYVEVVVPYCGVC
jgi:hypothetical protein